MGWYLVRGEQADGTKTVVRVECETQNDAIGLAQQRGLTNCVLETDEVNALWNEPVSSPGCDSPADKLKLRWRLPRMHFLFVFGQLLKQK